VLPEFRSANQCRAFKIARPHGFHAPSKGRNDLPIPVGIPSGKGPSTMAFAISAVKELVEREANFYRIHLLFFTFVPLILSGIFYAANGKYPIRESPGDPLLVQEVGFS